ncbi:MAG: hypothetical protein KBC46_03345 [Ferrovibrio sp.]|nr:hypothetical protein [Ferrovibrio sp.]
MTRNGAIAARFSAAVQRRLVPHTGITKKMLVHRALPRLSVDTLDRYLADATTIPASAIQALHVAFSALGCSGSFTDEVMGGEASVATAGAMAGQGPAPMRLPGPEMGAGLDLCFWSTHQGTLHSAPLGHEAAARSYLGLPPHTRSDATAIMLGQLGWVAAQRGAEGAFTVELMAARLSPEAARRASAWITLQSIDRLVVIVDCRPEVMARDEAAQLLLVLARQASEAEGIGHGWASEHIAASSIEDRRAADLWRAWHEAAALKMSDGAALEASARLGLIGRTSLFLVESGDAVSAHCGPGLYVDPSVVGRSLRTRRDRHYAAMVLGDLEQASAQPGLCLAHHVTRAAGGSYKRLAMSRDLGAGRHQVITASFDLVVPSGEERLQ